MIYQKRKAKEKVNDLEKKIEQNRKKDSIRSAIYLKIKSIRIHYKDYKKFLYCRHYYAKKLNIEYWIIK